MKKNSKLEVLPNEDRFSLENSVAEHPLIVWAVENGKILLYGLAGLVLIGALSYRFYNAGSAASEANFVKAESAYSQFTAMPTIGSGEKQTSAYNKLTSIIASHPELHEKYDGLIAQQLLIQNDISKASSYANSAITRTATENDPFYTVYAKNTLLIADKKYAEALKNSLSLKTAMLAQGEEIKATPEKIEFGTLLFALNLMRIGLLQQELSLKTDELNTWKEWKELSQKSRNSSLPQYLDSQLFISFEKLLGTGQSSFVSYIDEREKSLKSS